MPLALLVAPRMTIRRRPAFSTRLDHARTVALCASILGLSPNVVEPASDAASQWTSSPMPDPIVRRMPEVPSRIVSFDTTEGTFMSVDVSADGETLIFDLLGDIYQLPIDGGEAIALTTGPDWDQTPRFSPDGEQVYFVSDREAFKNIWRLTLADRSLYRVTNSSSDIMGTPNWSPDGRQLLAGVNDVDTGSAEIVLHSIDLSDGKMTPIDPPDGSWVDLDTGEFLRPASTVFSAVQTADGEVIFDQAEFDEKTGLLDVRLHKFDLNSRVRTTTTPLDASYSEYKPQLSHGGNLLAYFRQYSDRRTELRIRNRTTGQDKALIELPNADDASFYGRHDLRPNYAFTHDDRSVVLAHGGKILRVNLADRSSKVVPFQASVDRVIATRVQPTVQHLSDTGEAKIVRWPSLSSDGEMMAFAAIGYVWVIDPGTGVVRRLTRSSDFEYMPEVSPDGLSVAYVSFALSADGYGPGRLMIADIDGGAPRELLAEPSASFLIPKWSPEGDKIAAMREVNANSIDGAAFGWTPLATGEFHEVAPAPASSVYMNRHTYARFVGFDTSGSNLLFSYPRSRSEVVLATAGLNGDDLRTLAAGDSDVGGVTPAPDLKHLALTRRDGTVWLIPFDAADSAQRTVSTVLADARLVSDGGGYYVDWYRSDQLTYGFGQDIHRYRLSEDKLESLRVKLAFANVVSNQPIAFTGARLITMSDDATNVIESGTLVLIGRRIAAVGPANEVAIPTGAIVIDVAGNTIMPGLLDTHYHRIGGSSAHGLPAPTFSDRSAITYGITTAWDAGGSVDDGAPATAELQAAGRILGPRWSYAGQSNVGHPWETLTSYTAAFAAVERRRELGVMVLKEYTTPTRRQRQWLSAAAREQGLGIVAHIECFDCMMTRIVDGYTGGDHPYIPVPFYKDVRELLRQTGYIWTPNLVTTTGSIAAYEDAKGYYWQDLFQKQREEIENLNEITLSELTNRVVDTSPNVPYEYHRVSRVAEQVASAERAGIHIGVSAHNRPGSNTHLEMWHLWKGGMPIQNVLRAATIGNAEKLGLQHEIGSLEAGKIADFLVLEENPLDDILNTRSLKFTVQGGAVFDSDTAQPADLADIRLNDIAPLDERLRN